MYSFFGVVVAACGGNDSENSEDVGLSDTQPSDDVLIDANLGDGSVSDVVQPSDSATVDGANDVAVSDVEEDVLGDAGSDTADGGGGSMLRALALQNATASHSQNLYEKLFHQ